MTLGRRADGKAGSSFGGAAAPSSSSPSPSSLASTGRTNLPWGRCWPSSSTLARISCGILYVSDMRLLQHDIGGMAPRKTYIADTRNGEDRNPDQTRGY